MGINRLASTDLPLFLIHLLYHKAVWIASKIDGKTHSFVRFSSVCALSVRQENGADLRPLLTL